jgi:hypothetical protein
MGLDNRCPSKYTQVIISISGRGFHERNELIILENFYLFPNLAHNRQRKKLCHVPAQPSAAVRLRLP